MAEDCTENEFNVEEITRLQALFRGVLVRKWMNETREEYDGIFSKIENNSSSIHPAWKSSRLCRPTIQKKQKHKTLQRDSASPVLEKTKDSREVPKIKDMASSQQTIFVQTKLINGASSKLIDTEKLCENETRSSFQYFEHKYLTVETQTSFCEPSLSSKEKHTSEQCVQTRKESTDHCLPQAWEQNLEPVQTEKFKTVTESEVFTVEEVKKQVADKDLSDHEQEEAGDTDVKECLSPKQPTNLTSPGFSSYIESSAPTKAISPRGKQTTVGTSGGLSSETSVWDSFHSVTGAPPVNISKEPQYPRDYESLQDMRKNIAMELLWVQQAINSRKNYLKLKGQISA